MPPVRPITSSTARVAESSEALDTASIRPVQAAQATAPSTSPSQIAFSTAHPPTAARCVCPDCCSAASGISSDASTARARARTRVPGRSPAGPALRETSSDDFSVFHRGLEPAQLDRLLGAAEACGAWLNDRFGQEQILPRGKLVIAPRDETGYARKNYIVLTEPGERSEISLSGFLCHELAHFWSSRGNAMTVNNWLNEGFAVFVAARYVRERFGEEAYGELVADWQARSEGQPAVWVPGDTQRKPFAVNYKKAPLKLHALEQAIGQEDLAELLRRYMVDGISTTEQLLEQLEAIAGEPARQAFVQNLGE